MPLDNYSLRNAAKELISEYGDTAEREAQKRITKAESNGLKITATFWQKVQAIVVTARANS